MQLWSRGARWRRRFPLPGSPRVFPPTYLKHLVKLGLGLLQVPQDGEDGEHRGEVMPNDGLPGRRHDVLPFEHQPVQRILRKQSKDVAHGGGRVVTAAS